eukprot:jgi/Botrbrau1/12073/Bobra.0186s0002.2
MDALLAAIPTLTKLAGLSIRATAGTILPEGPRPNGFAGLRSLRLTLDLDGIGECGNFAAALAGLEFLMLSCDSDTWHKLAPHMPAMPRLTELQIYAHPPESLGYPSARFLAGLPRLRCLKLQNALAPSRWDEEVLYIAALTELTKLGISFPRWFHEASGYIHASMTWTQVQPLTALRQLDIVEVAPLLEAGVANRFCDSLRQVRQEMDLPATRILPMCDHSGYMMWSASHHLADVFLDYARRSEHKPESVEEELAMLIYNYHAYFTARDIVMEPSYDGPDITYFFDGQKVPDPEEPGHHPDDDWEAPARAVLTKFQ